MPAKRDPEIDALEAVYGALKELSPEVRMRVLKGVYALLGIQGTQSESDLTDSHSIQTKTPRTSEDNGHGTKTHSTEHHVVSSEGRQKSLMELLIEKQPKTNIERIALFAYYREKYEGKPRFGRDDIVPYFAKAKVIPPKNYSRDFGEAVKKGWIHEDKSDSYITSRGMEAVESGFSTEKSSKPAKTKPHSRSKNRQSNSKKQAKKARANSGKA